MTEILLEKYLASQFKFGFELEAFLKDGYTDVDYDADNYVEGVVTEIIASDFNFKEDEIEIKGDGSLSPDENDDYAFEWATPIMTFTPANLSRCINGLDTVLNSEGIYTNDTCGFHIHLSFPNMSDEDIIWVLSQLAVDNEFLSRLTYFKGIEFLDEEYANIDFIEDIGDYIKSGMYSYIARYFTTEKYRAFHIHSQGTLEWRGPRNFLNDGDIELIHEYIKKTYRVILTIAKILKADSWEGRGVKLNRKEFEKEVSTKGEFESPTEVRKSERDRGLADKVLNNPDFLLRLSGKGLEKAFMSSPRIVGNLLSLWGSWGRILDNMNENQIKTFINYLWNVYYRKEFNSHEFTRVLDRLITDRERLYLLVPNELRDLYERNILARIMTNDYFPYERTKSLVDMKSPEVVKLLNKMLLDSTMSSLVDYMKRLSSFNVPLDLEVYKKLLNSKYFYVLGEFDELPVKIQRMMLRKSPYMVQYIKNIDPAVLADLKKKHPDIENHLIGVQL